MKRIIIASLLAFGATSLATTGAQPQSLESLFVECRAGYKYDDAKKMCMLEKKAKKTPKKKVVKKAKAKA